MQDLLRRSLMFETPETMSVSPTEASCREVMSHLSCWMHHPYCDPESTLTLESMPMDCELRKVTSTGLSYTFGYICLNRTTFKRNCEGSASDNVVLQQALVVSSCVSLCSHSLNAVHSNMCATTVGEGVQLCMHAHSSKNV